MNDRQMSDTFALSSSSLTAMELTNTATNKFNTPPPPAKNAYEDKRIQGTGQYDLEVYKYDHDLVDDMEDIFAEGEEIAKEDTNELNECIDQYKRIVTGEIMDGLADLLKSVPVDKTKLTPKDQTKQRYENGKNKVKEVLGTHLFDQAYKFLREQRSKGVEDARVIEGIEKIVGNNATLLKQCYELDAIAFMENMHGI